MAKSRNNTLEFSSAGSVVKTGTGTQTGNFGALQLITTSTFTVLTSSSIKGTLTGIAIPAGTIIYGDITAFAVGAGETVIAHNL